MIQKIQVRKLLLFAPAFFLCSWASSQSVTGKVTDQNGGLLAGVSVQAKNSNKRTSTDAKGTFTINASKGAALSFSSVGYKPQEATVESESLALELAKDETNVLSDVVFDELRWKPWKESTFQAGSGVQQVWGQVTHTYNWGGDYLYAWPIPQAEIERNPNLTQNPGWPN